jgi:uncharacterized phage protein gp47/JayE
MAGVTDQGFVIKRLPEVLLDLQNEARGLFQDLVQPGEVVDVSPDAGLGRLIGLATPSAVDGWEAAQEVYSAFDPNSATGVPLDNLVAYAGITRQEQTSTTSPVFVTGDINTLITSGSVVSSPFTGERFNVVVPIALTPASASGIGINLLTVADSTLYTITYTNTSTTQNINFTSGVSATEASILAGIEAEIISAHPSLDVVVVGNTLTVTREDVFQVVAFTTSVNIGIVKVSTVGEVQAETTGPIEQLVNTITEITTPILGWDSVTNPIAASPGRLEETDEELRIRFRNTKFERATNTLDAIYSAIVGVSNVQDVVIYENDTDITDGNGVPGHSFLPIVLGGLSTDIANAIWENKPIGILSYGNTTVSISDIQGFPHDISFSRPDGIVIYISIDLTTDASYPANGDSLMKQALIDYFIAQFSIGDDVIYSRLYTPINSIPGHEVNSLTIGIAPAPVGMVNIPIAFDEIASLNDVNIVITT